MTTQRDNSPERVSGQERLQLETRREEIRRNVNLALSAIYVEHAEIWGVQAQAQAIAQRSVVRGAGDVVDHALLRVNIEAQTSELAADRAITEAQMNVLEALDEPSA